MLANLFRVGASLLYMASSKCLVCPERDQFISRGVDSGCECSLSEDKACRIIDDILKEWSKTPLPVWHSPRALLPLLSNGSYTDDFIIGRDGEIIDQVMQVLHYLFGREKLQAWEYLDIGCGTYVPTVNIAQHLGTYPLGIDFIDRRKCDVDSNYFSLMPDYGIKIQFGDTEFRFIMMCDILHHCPCPEGLVDEALSFLADDGAILIMDHNCESWEDHYYLDLVHLICSKALGSGDYLPTYGYRSQRYWRKYMKVRGYEVVYTKTRPIPHQTYVDVYRKKIK